MVIKMLLCRVFAGHDFSLWASLYYLFGIISYGLGFNFIRQCLALHTEYGNDS